MSTGDAIKAIRLQRKMSQAALSRASGLTKGFMSQVEAGRSTPSLQSLGKIARSLGVSVGELLREDAAPPPETDIDLPRVVRRPDSGSTSSVALLSRGPGEAHFLASLHPGATLVVHSAPADGGSGTSHGPASCSLAEGVALFSGGGVEETLSPGDTVLWDGREPFELTPRGSVHVLAFIFVPPGCEVQAREEGPADEERPINAPASGPFRIVAMRAERGSRRRGPRA